MNNLDNILKQNKDIKDFHTLNVDDEWNTFLSSVGHAPQTVTVLHKKKSHINMVYNIAYAIAATVVLVISFYFVLKPEPNTRTTFTSSRPNEIISLPDGSKIYPQNGAKLEYPLDLRSVHERKVVLDGDAKFVVKRSILPFKVYWRDVVIEVLGTEFSLFQSGEKLVIENHHGSVKVSDMNDKYNFKILSTGDKFEYKDGNFTDIKLPQLPFLQPEIAKPTSKHIEKEKPEEIGSIYTLGSLLKDHLVKMNKKTIKLDKKFKYDKTQRIKVNLNQSYIEIMQSLKNKGVINFIQGDCPNCYIITAPVQQ